MRDTNETNETNATRTRGRYVGPSAARIADLLPQRVRFEQGWFWTAAACHTSEQDRLQFRQRPDGEGIDVRCQRADNEDRCSRERAIRQLETLTGESIWSAYAAWGDSSPQQVTAGQEATGRLNWRLVLLPVLLLLLAVPVALGYDLQVVALNAFGFGWAGWFVRRILLDRLRSVGRRRS